MKVFDFLGKFLGKVKIGSSETISIEVPEQIYFREAAIYTAASLIANAISLSEFRVFSNNRPVIDEDYYTLNVAPNKNENSTLFWHRVINKMIRNPEGALVVEINGELHCAESFSIRQERPVLGNLYDGVVLSGGFQMDRIFRAEEVYLFKMEDENICNVINGLYAEYGKLLETAARAFRDTNGRKFKLKVDSVKTGDTEFANEYQNVIAENIKAYMQNEYATYVEYDGEELKEESGNKSAKDSSDLIKLREDIFNIVGQAFKIPQSLMTGQVTNVKDIGDVFLTFAVDPFADAITAVLNKRATKEEYLQGNYYQCYTGTQEVYDEDENKKYKAYPRCIMESGVSRSIENGSEEVKEVDLEISVMPDDYGQGMYEALDSELKEETVKNNWMSKFDPETMYSSVPKM